MHKMRGLLEVIFQELIDAAYSPVLLLWPLLYFTHQCVMSGRGRYSFFGFEDVIVSKFVTVLWNYRILCTSYFMKS